MGYYGKEITSSDKSDEMTWNIYSFFGIKDDEDQITSHELDESLTKEMIEGKLNPFIDHLRKMDIDVEQGQTVAYHLLKRGVEMSDDNIDFFIKCFKNDSWAEEDVERRILMKLAIKDLEKYKLDKTPVDIEHSYDLENYFIKKNMAEARNEKISTVEEIIQEIETLIDVKIIQTMTDRYALSFLVSEEDYKKVEPSGRIFGIKFYKLFSNE